MTTAVTRAEPVIHVVEDDSSAREATARFLRASGYAVRTYGSAEELPAATPTGSPGCVVLDVRSALLEAVRQALAGHAQEGPARSRRKEVRARYERLTPREREVFAHLISGQLNKQVGFDLGISERTIKIHRHQVLQKMQADSIVDLVRMAADLDVAPIGKVR